MDALKPFLMRQPDRRRYPRESNERWSQELRAAFVEVEHATLEFVMARMKLRVARLRLRMLRDAPKDGTH